MKLKNFTLLAIVGVSIFILRDIFYFFERTGITSIFENYMVFDFVMSVLQLIGWVLIGSFFVGLYKKQK